MLFQKKTVDSILSTFNKAVVDLTNLIDSNDQSVERSLQEIAELNTHVSNLNFETNRAEQVRDRLLKLVA